MANRFENRRSALCAVGPDLGYCCCSRLGCVRSAICLLADGGVGLVDPILTDDHECVLLLLRLVRPAGVVTMDWSIGPIRA